MRLYCCGTTQSKQRKCRARARGLGSFLWFFLCSRFLYCSQRLFTSFFLSQSPFLSQLFTFDPRFLGSTLSFLVCLLSSQSLSFLGCSTCFGCFVNCSFPFCFLCSFLLGRFSCKSLSLFFRLLTSQCLLLSLRCRLSSLPPLCAPLLAQPSLQRLPPPNASSPLLLSYEPPSEQLLHLPLNQL